MEYGILDRRRAGKNKCPLCRYGNVNFLDLGFGLLGCLSCGSVFVSKEQLQASKDAVVARKVVVEKEIDAPVLPMEVGIPGEDAVVVEGVHEDGNGEIVKDDGLSCEVCGKTFKNKLGLTGHRRSHK